jgi:hypothetical protein
MIFIITLLKEYGLLRYIESFAGKVVDRTAFGLETGQAFIAKAGSAYAGGGILVDMYKKGRISQVNLVLSVIFASFPAYVRLMLTSVGPVVFTLLAFRVAFFYVCFSLTAATCNMLIAGALSHRFIQVTDRVGAEGIDDAAKPQEARSVNHLQIVMSAFKQSARYAVKMVTYMIVITSVVFYCQKAGLFQKLPFGVGFLGLPERFNVVLYSYIGNSYAGMGIMGELIRSGALSTIAAIKLLVFCMLCSRPIVTLIEAPSYYFGFFGFKSGLFIMLFTLSVFSSLAITALIVMQILF